MTHRKLATTLLAAVVTLGAAAYAEKKQEAPKKKQTHCPVMAKNPINKKMYVDVEGKRIYVCCPGCITQIKADPDKFIKQMEAEGIEIENAPKKRESTEDK